MLSPIERKDREVIATEYLKLFSKTLTVEQLNRFVNFNLNFQLIRFQY